MTLQYSTVFHRYLSVDTRAYYLVPVALLLRLLLVLMPPVLSHLLMCIAGEVQSQALRLEAQPVPARLRVEALVALRLGGLRRRHGVREQPLDFEQRDSHVQEPKVQLRAWRHLEAHDIA